MSFRTFSITTAALVCLTAGLSAQTATKAPASSAAKKSASTAKAAPRPAPGALTTDTDKALYLIGLSLYKQALGGMNLSPAELDLIKRGMTDQAAGKPAMDLQTWGPKIDSLLSERNAKFNERNAKLSGAYLAKAATEPGVVKTDSGLLYKQITAGTGASPASTDTVKVNYRGTFINGQVFDESKQPIEFQLDHVIKCWTEGVQKMKVGGKARLVCPADIAYGAAGNRGIPGGSTLVFEVELLGVAGK